MSLEWDELERRNRAAGEGSRRIFGLGLAAAVAFLGWTHFFGDRQETVAPVEPAQAAAVVDTPVVEASPPRVPLEPLYQGPPPRESAGRASYVGVYECTVNGQRVVSDRPCGSGAQARTLVVDQPDPRDVAQQRHRQLQAQQQAARSRTLPSYSSGSAPSTAAPVERSNAAACAAVDRAIDDLNARMRQRYGAAEGEYLRKRWHELKDQRYRLGCGR